jgi:hypothetical protein
MKTKGTWLEEIRDYWAGLVQDQEDEERRACELALREEMYASTSGALEGMLTGVSSAWE